MAKLSSDDIARKFSKGQECEFWLTKKQAAWLLNVWQRETDAPSHFGRIQAKGEFDDFVWTANEGYHGSALFKVSKMRAEETLPQETLNHPVYQYAIENGYDWEEVSNDPDLFFELIEKSTGRA